MVITSQDQLVAKVSTTWVFPISYEEHHCFITTGCEIPFSPWITAPSILDLQEIYFFRLHSQVFERLSRQVLPSKPEKIQLLSAFQSIVPVPVKTKLASNQGGR
jgi:hypothetical protein